MSPARKKKTPRQLEHENSQALASSGQQQLAALFTDPAGRKTFTREMRHELLKKQTSEKTAAGLAPRPFTVKYLENGRGVFWGRYPSESEARTAADRVHGWVEHGGSVIYAAATR